MGAALIFNGHASPTRHDGLCIELISRGGAVLMVRPRGSAPHPGGLGHAPGSFSQITLDASMPDDVAHAFSQLQGMAGRPELVLFDGVPTPPRSLLDWTPEEAERSWRHECLAALVVGRQSLQAMLPAGRGTVIFIGQSEESNLRGPFSMGQANKAGVRAIAQSMARGFGPRHVHVAHLALPSALPEDGADGLGQVCWHLHQQHRTAWTHELDLR